MHRQFPQGAVKEKEKEKHNTKDNFVKIDQKHKKNNIIKTMWPTKACEDINISELSDLMN